MATFRIGQLESELPVKLHWWNEALNAFDDAAHISTSATMVAIGLDSAWLEKLRDSADLVLQASHEAISTATIERPRRIILLHTTAFDWPLRHLLALKVPSHAYLLLDLAQLHFKEAVTLIEAGEFRKACYQLHECERPIVEGLSFAAASATSIRSSYDAESDDLPSDFQLLQQDVCFHLATCESVEYRWLGDMVLERSMNATDGLSMDGVWEAVDYYRQAVLLTRERDLENEAAAMSRLGRVYRQVLKQNMRSRDFFKRCQELVVALAPKSLLHFDWCKECMEVIKEIQDERRQREEAEQQRARQPILDSLKDELQAIEKLKQRGIGGLVDLLRHIYTAHPPKKESHTLQEPVDTSNARQRLKKAFLHYHPDQQNM